MAWIRAYARRLPYKRTARSTSRYCTPVTDSARKSANGKHSNPSPIFIMCQHRLVVQLDHFRAIGGSALTDGSIAVPEHQHIPTTMRKPTKYPVTYVPFRNAHFLSVAVSWAEVISAHSIYIGAVAEDSSGYPDCRPEYYRVFQELIRVGTRPETNVEIATPVIALKKSEIIRKGIKLGAPLHLTWSCYQSEDTPCGVCDSCLLRMRAFAEAGASDPISQRGAAAHS